MTIAELQRRPRMRGVAPICVLLPTLLFLAGKCEAASLCPADLRTEYLVDPSGLDVARPRFSWTLQPADTQARGLAQTAYQIKVYRRADDLKAPDIMWDSGEVASDLTSQVFYGGDALGSGQAFSWQVRSRDQAKSWSDWSTPADWSTGQIEPGGWSAKWIGTGERGATGVSENLLRDPWFRREVTLDAVPTRAVAFVASVGFHELYVNGQKVGDAVLMPSVTDNSRRARYVTYDIAGLLHPGINTLGIWMGAGWSIYPAFATTDKPRAPIVKAQFDLLMQGGAKLRIITDSSWKTHASPNMLLGSWIFHKFGGEAYDANSEVTGWASAGLADADWKPAAIFEPSLLVSSERAEANRRVTSIKAASVTEMEPGVYRFDMGRNFSGWFEARVEGRPGDRVDFEISERPKMAMTFALHSSYVIGPAGSGVFENRFNYCAGRWITIRGLRSRPALDAVRGWLIRTDFARASAFECSDPILNQVYDTTLWTLENLSLGGYLVDCPHRERMGYGGDAHATTVTALMNYRADAFFTKWAEDWRDVQYRRSDSGNGLAMAETQTGPREEGNLPYTAPTYWGGGGPTWSGYCTDLPWELYRHTGDRAILSESFGTIERWLAFLELKSSGDLLRRWGGEWDFLGDWLWPGAHGIGNDSRETLFFNNCYWVYELSTSARIAKLLGKAEQSAAWTARAQAVKNSINQNFFNAEENSYVNGMQAYLAIALLADVPPARARAGVWKRLQEEILVAHKGHIDAGITGGAMLFKVLTEAHRNDLIYSMVSQKDYPGWGDLLARGETTFGESWDGNDSLLHSSYLFAGAWFINGVLGIQPGDSGGGFQRFTIWPGPVDRPGLAWARGHYDSMQGRIEVAWKRMGRGFVLDATVPPNTTAVIYLPVGASSVPLEGGQPLSLSKGIESSTVSGEMVAVSVRSGTYHFASTL